LLRTQDEKPENDDSVKLMTIHAAKGLEFPCVFVAGLEEIYFASGMSLYSREELEEERRLFYVAITKAMTHLTLSFATSRYKFGQLNYSEPSTIFD
jgi:DNA helicase-2/ATP-dependent DNA helicase PcrA